MTERTQKLLEEVFALSPEEHAEFLDLLSVKSITHDHGFASKEIAEEWDAEIERRLEEVDSGKVKAIPLEDVLQQMRRTEEE